MELQQNSTVADKVTQQIRYNAIQSITDDEFEKFRRLIYEKAGIALTSAKKMMVASRLQKRLVHYGLHRYGDYYRLVTGAAHLHEMQILIDHLTTNETYFFREPDHFDYLAREILPKVDSRTFRVWSAACSSGEEVYTLAMVLAEHCVKAEWEVVGSDLSQRVLEQARRGHYPLHRNGGIARELLKKYCLKGVGKQAGSFVIDKPLRKHVSFRQLNLKQELSHIGKFDVVFLRNVLIYFDPETKERIVNRVASAVKPGGYLFISHTESLHGIAPGLEMMQPSIFRKL